MVMMVAVRPLLLLQRGEGLLHAVEIALNGEIAEIVMTLAPEREVHPAIESRPAICLAIRAYRVVNGRFTRLLFSSDL